MTSGPVALSIAVIEEPLVALMGRRHAPGPTLAALGPVISTKKKPRWKRGSGRVFSNTIASDQ